MATPRPAPETRPEMHPQRWGDPERAGALSASAAALVERAFGRHETPPTAPPTAPPPPCGLDAALVAALRTRFGEEHVRTDDEARRLRTRGKSTPDLLRARAGDLADAPDVVVRPADHDEVQALLAWAVAEHVALVPFGGGTCVTGGLVARREGYAGVVSCDLGRLRRLLAVDPVSRTATLEPGLRGPEAEALLAEHGLTLGHLPQSFEHASIGGFAATRSSGQSSAGYGRFDAMVVGLVAATPRGRLALGSAPAGAAGPDLRQVLLGSEGTLGVLTAVTVRVRPLPVARVHEGWRWESLAAGTAAMRTLAQAGLLPTVLRLSDEAETAVDLADPGGVGSRPSSGPASSGGCLMIVGHEGTAESVAARRAAVTAVLERLGGACEGTGPGESWARGRFEAPYLRDSLLDAGVLVETLETATFWSGVEDLHARVGAALTESLGEGAMVLCHVSHVYETGCSLYFTVAAPQEGAGGPGADQGPLERWRAAKAAASDAIVDAGATITHHHAVGTDHKPWLAREIGPVGVALLRALKAAVDPSGVLNPGVLVP